MTELAAGLVLAPVVAALVALLVTLAREAAPHRVPILCYHRLQERGGGARDGERMWVCWDDAFAAQMAALAADGFTPIDLDDYVAMRAGRVAWPARPVAITFDDGYASNHALAFPVLRRLGFKATVFVALAPDAHTRAQVDGIDGFLTPEQLREMASHGISIQSHSLTHAVLAELDDAQIDRELCESRTQIEAITARPVRHFCVPRGGGSARVQRRIRAAGYETACGFGRGTATDCSDLLALPRIGVERDLDLAGFRRALRFPTSVGFRIAGALKVLPARLVGARRARRLRDRIYTPRLAPWFTTPVLARVVLAAGALYALAVGAAIVALTRS